MPEDFELILGEFPRSLDERYRVSIPQELFEPLTEGGQECILAKERPGCLSLWSAAKWQQRLDDQLAVVREKIRRERLRADLDQVQLLGRLLSTRHRPVKIAGRGRLLVPEGFREFLGVEPGDDVLIVGAALCLELWRPAAWLAYLEERMPEFNKLVDELSG